MSEEICREHLELMDFVKCEKELLEERNANLQKECQDLKQKLDSAEQNQAAVKCENENLQKECQDLNQKLVSSEQNQTAFKAESVQMTEFAEKMQNSSRELKNRIDSLETDLESKTNECRELCNQLINAEERKDTFIKEIQDLKLEIEALQKNSTENDLSKQNIEKGDNNEIKDLEDVRSKFEVLVNENDLLKSQLQELQESNKYISNT